jgi:hypothetical protein
LAFFFAAPLVLALTAALGLGDAFFAAGFFAGAFFTAAFLAGALLDEAFGLAFLAGD